MGEGEPSLHLHRQHMRKENMSICRTDSTWAAGMATWSSSLLCRIGPVPLWSRALHTPLCVRGASLPVLVSDEAERIFLIYIFILFFSPLWGTIVGTCVFLLLKKESQTKGHTRHSWQFYYYTSPLPFPCSSMSQPTKVCVVFHCSLFIPVLCLIPALLKVHS